ncbi:MAG: YlmC/YmxH family sporulation protein [Clostridia bacterium]|nr:YlmC/YmxH family sporulation protein [Clostridia bacterium]
MCKFSELKNKEVINVSTGERLGFVCDMEFDTETGKVNSIVLPPSKSKLFSFNKENETVILWNEIKKIGNDIIIVN